MFFVGPYTILINRTVVVRRDFVIKQTEVAGGFPPVLCENKVGVHVRLTSLATEGSIIHVVGKRNLCHTVIDFSLRKCRKGLHHHAEIEATLSLHVLILRRLVSR